MHLRKGMQKARPPEGAVFCSLQTVIHIAHQREPVFTAFPTPIQKNMRKNGPFHSIFRLLSQKVFANGPQFTLMQKAIMLDNWSSPFFLFGICVQSP